MLDSLSVWFGISKDTVFQTVFPTIITIAVFILTYYSNRFYDKYKEDKRLKDVKDYFYSMLRNIEKPIKKQADSLSKLSEQLNQERISNFEAEEVTNLDFFFINQVSDKDLFKIFVSNASKKEKAIYSFDNLHKNIQLVAEIKQQFRPSFEYLNTYCQKYLEKWNENIDLIGQSFDSALQYHRSENINPDSFFQGFFEIFHKWAEDRQNYRDMFYAVEHLINPLHEHCRQNLQNIDSLKIQRFCLNCLDAYSNYKNLCQLKSNEFKQYSISLLKSCEELENDLNILDKKS